MFVPAEVFCSYGDFRLYIFLSVEVYGNVVITNNAPTITTITITNYLYNLYRLYHNCHQPQGHQPPLTPSPACGQYSMAGRDPFGRNSADRDTADRDMADHVTAGHDTPGRVYKGSVRMV